VRSPLRWPGGKHRLAAEILSHVGDHQAYVEACCGGAAVFWAKPREWSKAEVLNDLDGELVNFYRVLHRAGRRLACAVDAMPYSRRLFGQVRRSRPTVAFARARRFWYINRVAFGSIMARGTFGVKSSAPAAVLPDRVLAELDATVERLRGVVFESLDVARLVPLYDRPTTLFYVDPPYIGPRGLYAADFTPADHARLADVLHAAAGTSLLSYDDCPEVRRLYRGAHRRRVSLRYTIRSNTRAGQTKIGRELLLSNRPLRRVRR